MIIQQWSKFGNFLIVNVFLMSKWQKFVKLLFLRARETVPLIKVQLFAAGKNWLIVIDPRLAAGSKTYYLVELDELGRRGLE